MDNMLYLVRMDAIRKKEKGADATIADYLLTHPDAVAHLTLQKLAEVTHTGYATVCRFFKKLGLSGFREFCKLYPGSHTAASDEILGFDIEASSPISFEEIRGRICDYASCVIASISHRLSRREAGRAVELMKNAEQIHFVGLGTSAVTARYAYTKFFRLKPSCSCETDIILSKMRAASMKHGDLLFAISSSGRTKSILEIAHLAKKNGATVLAVSDFENSPLATMADLRIATTVRDSNKYIDTDFPLIQGQITIIDVLYAYMYNQTSATSSHKIKQTKDAVTADKVKQ